MSDSDTPSQESGSDDGIAAFEAKLDAQFGGGQEPAQRAPAARAAAPAAQEDTGIPDELEDDTPAEEVDPDAIEDEAPEARVFKVKVDGKEIDVPEDELVKGYSRQQDYTKKTMELAGQRQQFEQAQSQIQAERQHHQAQLNQLTAALGEQLSNQPNWQELLDTDPVEYLKQQHLYTQRQAAYQQASQAQYEAQQQNAQQAAQAEQQRLAHERNQLLDKLPSWADDAKAAKERALIAKTLTAMGRTPEQLGKLDHIDVLVARKAALYDQMVAKAKDATAKVAALPPRMQKPGAPRATDARTVDMQSLRKSGSTADAASIFEKML